MTLTNYINIERIIHSVKTAIACLIGFLLARVTGLPADQWIVITIIVVMCAQLYVGSVIQKSYLRFLGTLAGCLFAMIVLEFFGHSMMTIGIGIIISSFIFSYLATGQENLAYTGTLGAVTTVIILLGQQPSPFFAVQRLLEINIGLLIATVASQFILPIHARNHLRRTQASTLTQIRDLYVRVLSPLKPNEPIHDFQDEDEEIVKALLKQRQLAKESKREPLGSAFDPDNFMQSLYCEREALRAILFMNMALTHLQHLDTPLRALPEFSRFNDVILQTLNIIINVIENNNPTEQHIHEPPLAPLKKAAQETILATYPSDHYYIDGLLFSAEILSNSLIKLATVYHVPLFNA